jgi:hypothetical protein
MTRFAAPALTNHHAQRLVEHDVQIACLVCAFLLPATLFPRAIRQH